MAKKNLVVLMNGYEVGVLSSDKNGVLTFQYSEKWLQYSNAMPVSRSLPLYEERIRGPKVYDFFQNLLPESPYVLGRIQAKFRLRSSNPFDLLSVIGRDCVGAVQLVPEETSVVDALGLELKPLDETEIAELLRESHYQRPLGMAQEENFRISLAGQQEKTALTWYQNRWHLPLRYTPTTHIFKLPVGMVPGLNIDFQDSCENEWLCLKIAQAYGLRTANAQIATFEDQHVLIVERFDRQWSKDGTRLFRLPQEDFCQALSIPAVLKYEADGGPGIVQSMKLLQGSRKGVEDQKAFLKAQVLFWMLAAPDGHGKNFGIYLEQSYDYSMTPLYDIMSMHPYIAQDRQLEKNLKMAMAVVGKNKHYRYSEIEPRHFISTAAAAHFSKSEMKAIMLEMAAGTERVIASVSSQLTGDFPVSVSEPIFDGLRHQSQKIRLAIENNVL